MLDPVHMLMTSSPLHEHPQIPVQSNAHTASARFAEQGQCVKYCAIEFQWDAEGYGKGRKCLDGAELCIVCNGKAYSNQVQNICQQKTKEGPGKNKQSHTPNVSKIVRMCSMRPKMQNSPLRLEIESQKGPRRWRHISEELMHAHMHNMPLEVLDTRSQKIVFGQGVEILGTVKKLVACAESEMAGGRDGMISASDVDSK